jgi:hypothetical protein
LLREIARREQRQRRRPWGLAGGGGARIVDEVVLREAVSPPRLAEVDVDEHGVCIGRHDLRMELLSVRDVAAQARHRQRRREDKGDADEEAVEVRAAASVLASALSSSRLP